jgi:gas vesicle protein
MFKKIKLTFGLVAGVILGLLFAPKKGKEIRDYCASAECKMKLHNAQKRVNFLKKKIQEIVKNLKSKIKK